MKYEIKGDTLPVVICELDAGETMITESGAMAWMSPNMNMETTTNGGIGKAFGRMFSGENLFQNRYTAKGGTGMIAFAEFDGHVVEYDLKPGQQIIVDSGYLAAMESTCQIDIQTVPGLKNAVFGGEGIFNTVITGPGRIWLQTMPIYSVAGAIRPYIPTGN